MILECAISGLQASLSSFTEQKGADICLGRIRWELEFLQDSEAARNCSQGTPVVKGGALGSAIKSKSGKKGGPVDTPISGARSILANVRSCGKEIPHMSKVVIQQLFLLFNAFVIDFI